MHESDRSAAVELLPQGGEALVVEGDPVDGRAQHHADDPDLSEDPIELGERRFDIGEGQVGEQLEATCGRLGEAGQLVVEVARQGDAHLGGQTKDVRCGYRQDLGGDAGLVHHP